MSLSPNQVVIWRGRTVALVSETGVLDQGPFLSPEAATSWLHASTSFPDPSDRSAMVELAERAFGPRADWSRMNDPDLASTLERAFRDESMVVLDDFPDNAPQVKADAQTTFSPSDTLRPPGETFAEAPVVATKRAWIEIELVDQDGLPVANERYRIGLPDGTSIEGHLNELGFAQIAGIEPGNCEITFPDVDGREWAAA
jgi:hypothetical protein